MLHRIFQSTFFILSLAFAAIAPGATLLESSLDFKNVDAEATKLIRKQRVQTIGPNALRLLLGLTSDGKQERVRFDTADAERSEPMKFLLVFKAPVPVGSIFFGGSFEKLYLLKGDEAPDADKMDAWQEVDRPAAQSGATLFTLPPGTRARALMLTASTGSWETHINFIRLTAARYANVVPIAQAYADTEGTSFSPFAPPFTYYADRITKGIGEWLNTAKNARGNIPRPPVSDIDPSWYLLTWRDKQTISGLWIADNFEKVELQSYAGPDDFNPREGVDKEWRKIRSAVTLPSLGGRLVQFDSLQTRGIRITTTKTSQGPIASITGLHAFIELKDAPLPNLATSPDKLLPPIKVPYSYPFDGLVTMVIDDEKGVRVRNLFAREVLNQGDNQAAWDLRDNDGRTVPLGKYTWKALAHPPLKLEYVTTVYPNVPVNSPENAPWHTSMNGSGGWMGDHTAPRAGAVAGDLAFLGSPVTESGVSMAVTDLTGKKLWAIASFDGFTGAQNLTADEKTVWATANGGNLKGMEEATELIYRVDLVTHDFTRMSVLPRTNNRARGIKGVANHDNKVYLAIGAEDDWFASAANAADVVPEACFPRYAPRRNERFPMEIVPDPRSDFLRLFRLIGSPPGEGIKESLSQLETTSGKASRRHIVLAFNHPIPVGSAIFPAALGENMVVRLAALKPDVPVPANPGDNDLWIPFETNGGNGFDVATAPKDLITQAIRVSVVRGEDDIFGQTDEKAEYEASLETSEGLKTDDKNEEIGLEGTAWSAKLDGMKLLSRRFENVATAAKIVVNSGKPNADRSWSAERTTPVTPDDPAIYAMLWNEPQKLRGLAFEEIDGKRTEIDVWTGTGQPDIKKDDGWKNIHTFLQPRRAYRYYGNSDARYLDSYINFPEEVSTSAVRLRICEQWLDRGDLNGPRFDVRDPKPIDPLRARVIGIAAMKYVGGESSAGLDPLKFQRIEVIDGTSGKVEHEVAVSKPGPLVASSTGDLFCISGKSIVKVDLAGGKHQTLLPEGDLIDPLSMAIDSKGNLYVYDNAPDRKNVRVYDPSGKYVRSIGETGGYQEGPWNPNRMQDVTALAVDKTDQLWVVSQTYWPKRVAIFSTDGTWKRDFLGNTPYGGGGCLDSGDKRRLFFNNLEFEIDWETGLSRLKNLTWLGNSTPGEVPIYIDGRCYLVSRGASNQTAQGVACVYAYDKDRLRPVAAMGDAAAFAPLQSGPIQRKLAGEPLIGKLFVWSDLNFNKTVDPDEVTFAPQRGPSGDGGDVPGLFDHNLGITSYGHRWEVTKFTPDGVPVYAMRETPTLAQVGGTAICQLDDKSGYFVQGNKSDTGVVDENGNWKWKYYTEQYTTHGYSAAKPYWPGQLVAQFYAAGHFTAHAGDLGEAFAFHTNMGSYDLITADGMVAGWIFNDQRLPGKRNWSMQEHNRGMDMSDVTIGQEHFSSYMTRTSDNRYYAVAGHNHVSLVEVLGLDKFKRLTGELDVSPDAIIATQEWETKHQKEVNYVRAPVIDMYRSKEPKKLDGNLEDWDTASASLNTTGGDAPNATFRASFDDQYLYVAWETHNMGPLANTGEQWDRLFKTGGSVDVQISVDGKSDPKRKAPVQGDKRILITDVKGRATAVLYDAVVTGTPVDKKWEAVSPIGKVSFDVVKKLDDALVSINGGAGKGYIVEAAIPLASIGFSPKDGDRIKLDWGILETDPSGNAVMRRTYWSNKATGIVADVPSEARLVPELWGTALIHDRSRRDFAEMTGSDDKIKEDDDGDMGKMLKEFKSDLEEDLKE